jgi:hypothetical protein
MKVPVVTGLKLGLVTFIPENTPEPVVLVTGTQFGFTKTNIWEASRNICPLFKQTVGYDTGHFRIGNGFTVIQTVSVSQQHVGGGAP